MSARTDGVTADEPSDSQYQRLSEPGQLRAALAQPRFRNLLAVRVASQIGDGLFQVGLAALIIFSPERLASPGQIAAAFALLMLPFSLVGPIAGPLLDRWRRRQVLVYANLVRAAIAIVLGLVMSAPTSWMVYALALIALGVNRFLLAGLSAGLPHTLPYTLLVMANAVVPTLGSIATALGAAIGGSLALSGYASSAILWLAAIAFSAASSLALRFHRDALGPERVSSSGMLTERLAGPVLSTRAALSAELRGLATAWDHLRKRGGPALALGVMASHRFFYGINVIALILISRSLLAGTTESADGRAMFTLIAGISLIGNALAIVITPIAHRWLSSPAWITTCLGISALSQVLLAFTWRTPWIFLAGILLGLGVQGVKIAVDTIIQSQTADTYRGRAFTFYDIGFNLAFVAAGLTGALILPANGWSPAVFVLVALAHILVVAVYSRKVEPIRPPRHHQSNPGSHS